MAKKTTSRQAYLPQAGLLLPSGRPTRYLKETKFNNSMQSRYREEIKASFRVYFPSIAVPVTRKINSAGYEKIMTINGSKINEWQMEGESTFEKNGVIP